MPITSRPNGSNGDQIVAVLRDRGVPASAIVRLGFGLDIVAVEPSSYALASSILDGQPVYARWASQNLGAKLYAKRIGKDTFAVSTDSNAHAQNRYEWDAWVSGETAGHVLPSQRSSESYPGGVRWEFSYDNIEGSGIWQDRGTQFNENGIATMFAIGYSMTQVTFTLHKLFGRSGLFADGAISCRTSPVQFSYSSGELSNGRPQPFPVSGTGSAHVATGGVDPFGLARVDGWRIVAGPPIVGTIELLLFKSELIVAYHAVWQAQLIKYLEAIRDSYRDGNDRARAEQRIASLRLKPQARYTAYFNQGHNPWMMVQRFRDVADLLYKSNDVKEGVDLALVRRRVEGTSGSWVIGAVTGPDASAVSLQSMYPKLTNAIVIRKVADSYYVTSGSNADGVLFDVMAFGTTAAVEEALVSFAQTLVNDGRALTVDSAVPDAVRVRLVGLAVKRVETESELGVGILNSFVNPVTDNQRRMLRQLIVGVQTAAEAEADKGFESVR